MPALLIDRYRVVLCDLDGCLIAGDRVLDGAAALVERLGSRLHIVSNNSRDTAVGLSDRLGALGLPLPAQRIHLAGQTTLEWLARTYPGSRVHLLGSAALMALSLELGLIPDERAPQHVVLTRDTTFDYARLQQTIRLLSRGAALVVTNPDVVHPGSDGLPVPETGSMLAWLRACVPDVEPHCLGKPDTAMIDSVLAAVGCGSREALFVGDNPLTDGEAARRAGMDFWSTDEHDPSRCLQALIRWTGEVPGQVDPTGDRKAGRARSAAPQPIDNA